MASFDEIRKVRLEKLAKLKAAGMDPYPASSKRDFDIAQAVSTFEAVEASKKAVCLAGRVMSLRPQGGLAFFHLFDGTGKFQALIKKGEGISDALFDLFSETVDIGDFVEVTGTFFVTKRGEKTVQVQEWRMLTKTIRTLPDKWHGLQDTEERYRRRYLDILMNPDLRDIFVKKAKFWDVTRNFLKSKGFMEVETPSLEVTTGGAEARPFKTHHNDYDLDVFMRISVGELWQKRLMAAGFPKTFEIGKIYRNEGSSPEHLQEFTNMEFYWAFANYEEGMRLVRELYLAIAQEVFGTTKFASRGHEFDFAGEWPRVNYVDEIRKQTGIDVLTATEKEMEAKLRELHVKYEGSNKERLTDTLWKYCRKGISGPAFLVQHPKLVSALAKESSERPGTVERFQVLIGGSEVGNGYSELNDPIDQEERFKSQSDLINAGDNEAMMPDHEFVEMLEYGMPPTCGFGFGERLFAFLIDKPLRETVLFPLMRPRDEDGKKETREE
jgi:lysyl-tRNA synthetase class 2